MDGEQHTTGTDQKAAIREAALTRRDALSSGHRRAASAAIRTAVAALPAVARARTLLGFVAFGTEVDLDPLLAERMDAGVGVFLPWIERFSPPTLQMTRVTDLDTGLVPARLGIREPDPAHRRPARVDRLDVVLAPGVAFDRTGGRLGYGAGFYDRLLDRLRPGTPVVAVAFATQLVDRVPQQPHDRRVHTIVTEHATIDASAPDPHG